MISAAEEGMALLLNQSREMDVIGIVGAPVAYHNMLLNCGIVFQHGRILGIVPKTFLPNYNEFYENVGSHLLPIS